MIISCLQLSFVLSLTITIEASVQNSTTGFQGGAVVLQCSTTSSETKPNIFWSFGVKIVHDFVNGKDDLSDQDKQFHNRTRLFQNEIQQGNFSLELSNLHISDNGVYSCLLNSKLICEITLHVKEHTKVGPHGSSTRIRAEVIYQLLALTSFQVSLVWFVF